MDPPAAVRLFLVADDVRDMTDMLSTLLEMHGHSVLRAYDGQEALDTALAHKPDVLLLDVSMPRLSGLAVCRQVRETDWGASALLVAMSGWVRASDEQAMLQAGFDATLTKPFALAELEASLGQRLRRPAERRG